MDGSSLWLAFALVLVLEGLMPFLSPTGWRRMFKQVLKMNDGQVRFFDLCSVALVMIGIALFW